jgi:phosphatidate cytidylyltransferase
MHLKRWITGVVALPFLVFFVYRGGVWFCLLVAAAAEIGLWEYYRIALKPGERVFDALPLIGFLTAAGLLWAAFNAATGLMAVAVAFNLMAGALVAIIKFGTFPQTLTTLTRQILGIVYVPLSLSFLILMRGGAHGMQWLFFMLIIVFASDTSALYIGSFYGRRKLSPNVSPGKTVEGSLGGLAAGLIFGLLGKALFLPSLAWPQALLFSLMIAVAGQIGDLFESLLKRSAQVKDSGTLLPGHGGILDRVDALMFAAPVAYFFSVYTMS